MTNDIDELCRRLLPVLGEHVRNLWTLYQAEDQEGRRWLELELKQLAARHLGMTFEPHGPLLEPPPAETCDGEYRLGMVCYNGEERWPFGMREDEWIHHITLFGRSGTGKSNVGVLMLKSWADHGKPFIAFDWKRTLRDAISLMPNMLVFTVGRDVTPFRFNPLIPPNGTPPKAWLKKVNEVSAHSLFLGEGVKYLLQNAIDTVYRDYGVYTNEVKSWPTLMDVKANLEITRPSGRQAEWKASTMRALGALCFGEFGEVLNVRKPFPMEELLRKQVVLELDALASTDKTFFTEALLLWIHHYRMAEGTRESFKHAIYLDEAHHILLAKKQQITGEETVTDVIMREIRELGEAAIASDQSPALMSKPALANTGTTICMNLKHADDVRSAADAMQLFGEDRRCLGEIPVGTGVVRLQSRWPRPFLVRFPHSGIKKGTVSDADLRKLMDKAALGNPFGVLESRILADRAAALSADLDQASASLPEPDHHQEAVRKAVESPRDHPPADELAFLKDVALNPGEATHERYRRLGLTFYKGNKLRDSLAEKGLLNLLEIKKKDGRVKLVEPTKAGRELLARKGVSATCRHGGAVHAYWVRHAAAQLRQQGWAVQVEKPIGSGACVDVAAEKDGVRMAVEVETGKSNAAHNVRRALAAGFDRVVVLGTDENALASLRIPYHSYSHLSKRLEVTLSSTFITD